MKMYKIIASLLVALLLLTACGTAENEGKSSGEKTVVSSKQSPNQGEGSPTDSQTDSQTEPQQDSQQEQKTGMVVGGVRITEVGTLTEKFKYYGNNDLLVHDENGQIQLLDMNGNKTTDKLYDDVVAIIDDGIVIVSMDSDSTPKWGVVNAYTGQELVACEAARIWQMNDRYLLINYYTGAATKDEHYDYYTDDNHQSVYYNGYGNILDLQKGQIVPGLKVTTDVDAAGNMLYVELDNKTTKVYGADGKSVGTYEYLYTYSKSDLAIRVGPTGFFIYDKDFKEQSYIAGNISDFKTIDGVNDMLTHTVWENNVAMYQFVDLDGNVILGSYKQIGTVYENGFSAVKEQDGPWGYVSMDGKVIVPFEYQFVRYIDQGYVWAQKEDGTGDVYNLSGDKLNTAPLKGNEYVLFDTEDGFFAPETGVTVQANYMNYLGYGLVEVAENAYTSYTSTIYNALTGEVVFENVEECICTGSHLYIWDGQTEQFTHYELQWA